MLVLLALVLARLAPPSPLPMNALPDRFSAGRAAAVLGKILGDSAPHPVGSEANAKVRERIVERLRELGYSPDTQPEFVCGAYAVCAPITNIIAGHEGRRPGKAIALVAHYDSVPAGPGAADDGAGVATLLEIARVLKLGPPPRHPVVFLFTDGEEAGLLGAQAFVERHPLARDIHAVINMEARGTRGPSLLFETRGDEAWLVDAFARHVPRPVTSSIFSAVYEKMPNDSDLSVFSRAGISGANFAFLGGVAHYHTPLDDLAHLSLASLQHHGDNALAMVRALADAEPETLTPSKAIYFDLLSLVVIGYPENLALPLAGLALLAMAGLLLVITVRHRESRKESARALFAQLLSPAIAAVTSLGLIHLVGLLGVTRNWVAYPAPLFLTFLSVGVLAVILSSFFTRGDSPLGTHLGAWLGWSILGVMAALLLPAASYLFLLPTMGAAIAGGLLLWPKLPQGLRVAAFLIPALLAGLVWFPIFALLYEAVGLSALPILATGIALVLGSLLPFASGIRFEARRQIALPAALAIVGIVMTALLPLSSQDVPERLSLSFHQDDETGLSHWLAQPESGSLPKPMFRHMTFGPRMTAALPWSYARAYAAPAKTKGLAAARVELVTRSESPDERHMTLRVRAGEDSDTLHFAFPAHAPLQKLTVVGERPSFRDERGLRHFTVRGVPKEGIEIVATISGHDPIPMTVIQSSRGLPTEARSLVSSRPKAAVPSQEGDVTLVSRRFEL